jgi:hypothetical protein
MCEEEFSLNLVWLPEDCDSSGPQSFIKESTKGRVRQVEVSALKENLITGEPNKTLQVGNAFVVRMCKLEDVKTSVAIWSPEELTHEDDIAGVSPPEKCGFHAPGTKHKHFTDEHAHRHDKKTEEGREQEDQTGQRLVLESLRLLRRHDENLSVSLNPKCGEERLLWDLH